MSNREDSWNTSKNLSTEEFLNMEEFAKVSELKEGDAVTIDGGFTCMEAGSSLTVKKDDEGNLYVLCKHGHHFLDGQISGREKGYSEPVYVGIYQGVRS